MTLHNVPVLVTGADGFIGSHLVERLVRDGARVRAFCMYTSQTSWGWLDDLPDAARHLLDVRFGDIRDARFVEACCEGIEVAFHLAALIAIPFSYVAPESVLDTNVRGTLNVLEAVRRHRVRRLVHTSTSEVYGTPTTLPIRETHPLNAQSPYAASKVAADQLALSYHRSFETPVTIIRPFNTYGPRQSTRAVLQTLLVQLLEGRTEIELGRLDTRRDLTFVEDTVDGLVRGGTTAGLEGETIQLGTGRSVSVAEMLDLACRVLERPARAVLDPRRMRPAGSEVMVLESDPSRARQKLGWVAAVSLEDGLRRTAEWLRPRLGRYKPWFLHV
jgi:NAD dependent epimerase/dehydratase